METALALFEIIHNIYILTYNVKKRDGHTSITAARLPILPLLTLVSRCVYIALERFSELFGE